MQNVDVLFVDGEDAVVELVILGVDDEAVEAVGECRNPQVVAIVA